MVQMLRPQVIIVFIRQLLRRAILIMAGLFCIAMVVESQARRVELADTRSRVAFWTLVTRGELPELVDAWFSRGFWLEVVRDMLPGVVALVVAFEISAHFVRSLYDLDEMGDARGFLRRMLFGQTSFRPWLLASEGILKADKNHVLLRVGGPGYLVIYNDTAVLLQKAGRLTRIETQGFPKLEPFETVYDAIDLRPKRKRYPVSAMTKEGIPVTCEVDISLKIEDEGQALTKDLPYPAQKDAVFNAITSQWACDTDIMSTGKLSWEDLVVAGYADAALRSILARYPLDQLIQPVKLEDGQEKPSRQAIREELKEVIGKEALSLGVKILHVDLGYITMEDEVLQQWIEAWQTDWESWRRERQAIGEAEYTQQVEAAKARAQVDMIAAIAGAVQHSDIDDPRAASQRFLLRLITMLGGASDDPWTRAFLPSHVIRTLRELP